MANRRLTFRLYPTKIQKKKLFLARKLHQLLYNACVAHRRFEWRKNQKSVDYFTQQNALPGFRQQWPDYQQLNLSSLQATVKRVDLAYNAFFKGIRKSPKFKPIGSYSGWTYPDGRQGFKTEIESTQKYAVNCGWVTLNDLDMRVRMRGRFKYWGKPTTCTITYRPSQDEWYASLSIKTSEPKPLFGSKSPLDYDSMVAFDLGTQTALTCYDGYGFDEISNPRFDKEFTPKIKKASKGLKRKQRPVKGKQKASSRWKKAAKKVSRLKTKESAMRKDWQHKVTTDIASCYDIVVTEKLNVKAMTRKAKTGKRKKQKAGLNRSMLDVGFGTLNQMALYKILGKGGLHITVETRRFKPSQRCPNCGMVHKEWAQLSNRYHICDDCGFEIARDRGSVMVMWNVAADRQPGLGASLVNRRCSSSTNSTRKHTGSMFAQHSVCVAFRRKGKQLGQMKRSKSQSADFVGGDLETPSVYTAG